MTVKDDHEQLVHDLAVSGRQLFDRWSPHHCFASHMVLGLAGEMLELDAAYAGGETTNLADETHIIEELGDLEFFLAGLYQIYNRVSPPAASDSKIANINQVRTAVEAVVTQVKRHIYYDKKDADISGTLDTLSHTLEGFYWMHGLDRDDVLEANITKLRKRYGEKYSDAAAHARRDKNPAA